MFLHDLFDVFVHFFSGSKHNVSGRTLRICCGKSKLYGHECEFDLCPYIRAKSVTVKPSMDSLVKVVLEKNVTIYTTYTEICRRDFLVMTRRCMKLAASSLNDKFILRKCKSD